MGFTTEPPATGESMEPLWPGVQEMTSTGGGAGKEMSHKGNEDAWEEFNKEWEEARLGAQQGLDVISASVLQGWQLLRTPLGPSLSVCQHPECLDECDEEEEPRQWAPQGHAQPAVFPPYHGHPESAWVPPGGPAWPLPGYRH